MGPGVPHPAPSNPIGICGNPSQGSPVSCTWGLWGWVSWVSPPWRSGSGGAGKGWPQGPRRAPLLSQASSTPVPTRAAIPQSRSDSRVRAAAAAAAAALLLLLRPPRRGGKKQEGKGTNPKPLIRDPGGGWGIGDDTHTERLEHTDIHTHGQTQDATRTRPRTRCSPHGHSRCHEWTQTNSHTNEHSDMAGGAHTTHTPELTTEALASPVTQLQIRRTVCMCLCTCVYVCMCVCACACGERQEGGMLWVEASTA